MSAAPVEWLNEQTIESLSLYAVQLEVLGLNDSPPAIRFNVITQPNEVVRAAPKAGQGLVHIVVPVLFD